MRLRRAAYMVVLLVAAGCGGRRQTKSPPMEPKPAIQPTVPATQADAGDGASARTTPPGTPAPVAGLREVFPGVRADVTAGTVEFDGMVPIDAHDPKKPRVYLEVVACTLDSKEHEALVMTRASAAHVHAALLLAGFVPGSPGAWNWEGTTLRETPPTGDRVTIELVSTRNGSALAESPTEWIVDLRSGKTMRELEPNGTFVFGGSVWKTRGGRDTYMADDEGAIVGLTTFGTETIGWSTLHSPEASVEEPRFIARPDRVPAQGTPVVVRLTRR